jgi:hypothetical protein
MNDLEDVEVVPARPGSHLRRFAERNVPAAVGLVLGVIIAFLLAWLCGTPLPF